MSTVADIPSDLVDLACELAETDPEFESWLKAKRQAYGSFVPRPDNPAEYDQQHSFCYNRDQMAFLIGGNAAGTTEAAAFKTALFVLQQQAPPRRDTPFWIASNTKEQSAAVCWLEKLHGHGHIPDCEVHWEGITWEDKRRRLPATVPLKPWPSSKGGSPDCNWRLHFKSFEQGRELMQGESIGGFWFSEQFPHDMLLETFRGCREYLFAGGQFAEFTPIDPDLSVWVEEMSENLPEGWAVYRANTRSNRKNLGAGWFDQFFGVVSDEMIDTRMTGKLASHEGLIYPSFNPLSHVIPESEVSPPEGAWHSLGTDWGASEEHPFVTLFGCRDGLNDWLIYDEYFSTSQDAITEDHAKAVLDMAAEWGWPVEKDPASRTGRRIVNDHNPLYGQNYADPSRPGEISAFSFMGVPTISAVNDVLPGIQYVRNLFKTRPSTGMPRVRISSRCRNLIKCLKKYRWMRGKKPKGGAILNPQVAAVAPLKRDDDSADAFRYLTYSTDLMSQAAPGGVRVEARGEAGKALQLRRGIQGSFDRAAMEGVFQRSGGPARLTGRGS